MQTTSTSPATPDLMEKFRSVETAATRAKCLILRDVALGKVPANTPDYSALYDYIAPDQYIDETLLPAGDTGRLVSDVEDVLESWVADGGLRK